MTDTASTTVSTKTKGTAADHAAANAARREAGLAAKAGRVAAHQAFLDGLKATAAAAKAARIAAHTAAFPKKVAPAVVEAAVDFAAFTEFSFNVFIKENYVEEGVAEGFAGGLVLNNVVDDDGITRNEKIFIPDEMRAEAEDSMYEAGESVNGWAELVTGVLHARFIVGEHGIIINGRGDFFDIGDFSRVDSSGMPLRQAA